MIVETVKIVAEVTNENPHGYVVINKSDLSQEHTVFEDESTKKKTKAKAEEQEKQGG